MANEPKGPYRKGDVAFGYIDLDTREAAIANAAWLAGRASRDGLRKALCEANLQIEYLHGKFVETSSGVGVLARIGEALAEDEKEGR